MAYDVNALSGRLRIERKKRGWDIPRMAAELRHASDQPGKLPGLLSLQRNIERWESGQVTRISERYRLLYATAFDIPDTELFPPPPEREISASIADDEDMERRKLLGSLVALGAVSTPALDALGDIQGSVEKVLGIDTTAHLDEWERTLTEYWYTFLTTPAAQNTSSLAADLVAVRAIMSREKLTDPLRRSWCRIVAGLSMLLAKSLSGQQRPREARAWWTTAQQAADTSGDTDMSLWVSGENLIHGLYEHRPTPVLLRRANDITDRTGDAAYRGLACVLAARAQLLAIDGRADETEAALRQTADLFSRLPSSVTADQRSMAGWGEKRLRYTEAFAYAHLGDAERTAPAVERSLALNPRELQSFRTQLELLHGFGLVRSGDVTEGVRHAQKAIEANPDARRKLMAASIAGDVLNSVPTTARRQPAVAGYRELLARDSPKSLA